jgi:hypothetical protein
MPFQDRFPMNKSLAFPRLFRHHDDASTVITLCADKEYAMHYGALSAHCKGNWKRMRVYLNDKLKQILVDLDIFGPSLGQTWQCWTRALPRARKIVFSLPAANYSEGRIHQLWHGYVAEYELRWNAVCVHNMRLNAFLRRPVVDSPLSSEAFWTYEWARRTFTMDSVAPAHGRIRSIRLVMGLQINGLKSRTKRRNRSARLSKQRLLIRTLQKRSVLDHDERFWRRRIRPVRNLGPLGIRDRRIWTVVRHITARTDVAEHTFVFNAMRIKPFGFTVPIQMKRSVRLASFDRVTIHSPTRLDLMTMLLPVLNVLMLRKTVILDMLLKNKTMFMSAARSKCSKSLCTVQESYLACRRMAPRRPKPPVFFLSFQSRIWIRPTQFQPNTGD